MKRKKMRKKIDQLLIGEHEDEAALLIKEVWKREAKEAQTEQIKLINQLNRRIKALENSLKLKR